MTKLMNGEHWRIITPILLSLLSALTGINIWILQDMRYELVRTSDVLIKHISSYDIHNGKKEVLSWVSKTGFSQ